ncbi:DUF3859 domain-containing protein [Pseudooceanicola nanhaiensis]|uniref:DUF3859 domain-containing protein n=1 Tax=Pseudooceanicola nanhaiensis TaxID=375761 RepID=UPI001CD24E5F|nr:DUF3859 domain-containing protein [Pseudooceanicola nanhaiensis]MCA0918952.1 DUF3859 domain-containing protein [Pseudooceanicola nanhaiensis]
MLPRIVQPVLILPALLGWLAGPAQSEAGDFVSAPLELIESGLFCPHDSHGRAEAPDTELGYINLVPAGTRVDFATHVAPGELGMGFGIRFQLAEGAAPRRARIVITHPPIGPAQVTRESWVVTLDTTPSLSQFVFSEDYEIQTGLWVMEIVTEDETLLRQSFTVVPAGDTLISVKMCEGPSLLS